MPIVCVVLFLGLFILIEAFVPDMTTGQPKGAQQRDVLVLVLVVISFFVGFATSSRKASGAKAAGAAATKRILAAARSWPGVGLARATGVRGFLEREETQWQLDQRILDRARRQSDGEPLSAVMGACARCDRADVALEVFGFMIEKGISRDHQQHSIDARTAGKFFKLVADSLDEERAWESGVLLLEAIRSHGLAPTVLVQNRLIRAWRSERGELPEHVVHYFQQMREEGVELSSMALRCVAAA